MGLADRRPTKGGVGGSGGSGAAGSALPAGGMLKRPLDPLADKNDALETVRMIRRRLVLSGGDGDDDGTGGAGARGGSGGGGATESGGDGAVANGSAVAQTTGGGDGAVAKANGERRAVTVQISNADLAELLRSTKPKGDPRRWAKVLYRAQNSRQGTHAGEERRKTVGLRG